MKATETLYENIELNTAFSAMLQTYNETCNGEGLCNYYLHEETRTSFENLNENSTAKDLSAIKGSGAAHFGSKFYEHETFKNYATACDDAGGELICVDASLNLEGKAGAAFFSEVEEGIDMDVELEVTSYPVCLTKECEGEEMFTTLENTVKNAVLKSSAVEEEIGSHLQSIIKAATVKQVCALSGLETCEFIVDRQECGLPHHHSGSSTRTSHSFGGTVAVSVLTVFAFVVLIS